MSVDQKKIEEYIQQQEDEWEELDRAAEECEQAIFEEVAAAKVEKAKMEAKHAAREEAQRKVEEEEAKRAEKKAMMAAQEADLSEEEVLKRRAVVAARDGIKLRRTLRMAIFFAALGIVEAGFGFLSGRITVACIGAVLFGACASYALRTRPRYKAAVEHFNVLSAELEEYYVKNPQPETPAAE